MQKIAIFVIGLLALVTLINAYTVRRGVENTSQAKALSFISESSIDG